ncbi:MAG: 2-dehydropantoate 2-reductase [Verrucomicrobiota bacterium]
MKIGIVGCGALGSYYGAKLGRDGHEVQFLLRSDYEIVRRNGVRILSREGDFHLNPKCAREPGEIGECDLVLVSLKTTANDQFAHLIPPLVGTGTIILTLQNGLGNEAELAKRFGPEKIMGGLCFVCLNRVEPGRIQVIDSGSILLGEFERWPEPRTHDVASIFRHAGVPCKVTDNLAKAHWEKLIWNIPFNGLGVAGTAGYEAVLAGRVLKGRSPTPSLTTKDLLSDENWERLVRELMREVLLAALALGFRIPDQSAEKQIQRTRAMPAYKASTLIDFEQGKALELNALFLEPLRQAREAGAGTPRLVALCEILQELEAGREEAKD